MRHGTSVLLGMLVVALVGRPMPARAVDLAGMAWVFSGWQEFDRSHKQDAHYDLKGRGRGRLAGSSCCERFVVGFPTAESFSLRHSGYVIATGSVRQRRNGAVLVPDGPSVGMLLWWLENFVEFSWDAGPFDIGLNLWLTAMKQQSLTVAFKTAGGQSTGTLKLTFRFRGDIRGFDPTQVRRLATGPATGTALFREQSDYVVPLAELDEEEPPSPLPPIVPCSDDEGESEAFLVARGWPHPDYCRQ